MRLLKSQALPHTRRGTYGKEITIDGTGFCDTAGEVIFAKSGKQIPANITNWADTEILASVPWGCNRGLNKVTVATSENNSNRKTFKFIRPKPRISGLSAKLGIIGSELEISGRNFGEEDGKSQVRFNKARGDIVRCDVNNRHETPYAATCL